MELKVIVINDEERKFIEATKELIAAIRKLGREFETTGYLMKPIDDSKIQSIKNLYNIPYSEDIVTLCLIFT